MQARRSLRSTQADVIRSTISCADQFIILIFIVDQYFYPPMKSQGYSLGFVRASVHPSVRSSIPSALFVRPEPYLSTYWSDLIHSWYK